MAKEDLRIKDLQLQQSRSTWEEEKKHIETELRQAHQELSIPRLQMEQDLCEKKLFQRKSPYGHHTKKPKHPTILHNLLNYNAIISKENQKPLNSSIPHPSVTARVNKTVTTSHFLELFTSFKFPNLCSEVCPSLTFLLG